MGWLPGPSRDSGYRQPLCVETHHGNLNETIHDQSKNGVMPVDGVDCPWLPLQMDH